LRPREEQDTIRADAVMPVAQEADGFRRDPKIEVGLVENEVVVPEAVRLDKFGHSQPSSGGITIREQCGAVKGNSLARPPPVLHTEVN
jgi:hypothetical protein